MLVQDMVFVPEPEFSRFTFGLAGGAARVVPSDAVVTALAQVLPAELVQKAILLGIFVLGCSGTALLVPSDSLGPRLVAGAFYVWNPYVAERLLIGQWALLLGYAGLPWVVRAVWSGRRLALAMLPAAVGGFAAMTVTAITALPAAVPRPRVVAKVAVVLALFSLPWLVVTALRPYGIEGDPVGGSRRSRPGRTRRSARWAACCRWAGSGTRTRCRPATRASSARWPGWCSRWWGGGRVPAQPVAGQVGGLAGAAAVGLAVASVGG
ncbi:hypothetical protein [Nonomuraea salmonea]|uniref:hypothetical protein n=1 Tax=Nonomuraea salmonea TaxID=46181 RepID=UPI002FEA9636